MKITTKKITLIAILVALALIIFIVEAQIPLPIPIPGVKLGLANAVTLFALFYGRIKPRSNVLTGSSKETVHESSMVSTTRSLYKPSSESLQGSSIELTPKSSSESLQESSLESLPEPSLKPLPEPSLELSPDIFSSSVPLNPTDVSITPTLPSAANPKNGKSDTLTTADAFNILICRIILGALFTGRFIAFFYSLSGGMLGFTAQVITKKFVTKKQIWVCGAIGAVFHNIGQILAAIVITGAPAIIAYLPMLIVAGIITGILTGLIAQFTLHRLSEAEEKEVR